MLQLLKLVCCCFLLQFVFWVVYIKINMCITFFATFNYWVNWQFDLILEEIRKVTLYFIGQIVGYHNNPTLVTWLALFSFFFFFFYNLNFELCTTIYDIKWLSPWFVCSYKYGLQFIHIYLNRLCWIFPCETIDYWDKSFVPIVRLLNSRNQRQNKKTHSEMWFGC